MNTKGGKPVSVRRGDILLFVTSKPGKPGEVSFSGGYPFEGGSTVTMEVDGTTFNLVTEGEWLILARRGRQGAGGDEAGRRCQDDRPFRQGHPDGRILQPARFHRRDGRSRQTVPVRLAPRARPPRPAGWGFAFRGDAAYISRLTSNRTRPMTAPITQDVLTIPRKLPEGGKPNLVGMTRDQMRAALIPPARQEPGEDGASARSGNGSITGACATGTA